MWWLRLVISIECIKLGHPQKMAATNACTSLDERS